jgi:thiamine-phosphate pyrophosphorylase
VAKADIWKLIMSDCLLYLISPPQIQNLDDFVKECRSVFTAANGTIGAFQLRLKQHNTAAGALTQTAAADDDIRLAATAIMPLCQEFGISFILNDNAQLAKELGADGVHLGQEDGNVLEARALLGEAAIIGVSCHASRHLAMEAGDNGADYVAFGAFYPTTSKSAEALQHWGTPDHEILSWWVEVAELPCVAIGGITPDNAAPLIAAGADFIAVISSVWHHPQGAVHAIDAFASLLKKETYEISV